MVDPRSVMWKKRSRNDPSFTSVDPSGSVVVAMGETSFQAQENVKTSQFLPWPHRSQADAGFALTGASEMRQ
jgi:hypothetical protein